VADFGIGTNTGDRAEQGIGHRADVVARQVHFHDPNAPIAACVVPSAFVAVRDEHDRLLLVRRRDSGNWELPGGRVDVGESAVEAAVRETTEEAGVRVQIEGLVGLFTDPAHVVRSVSGEIRQQFVVCFRARPVWGRPRPDLYETVDVAWFDPSEVAALDVEPAVGRWIEQALSGDTEPCLS
jgi:8-oxo-dGTP pyrophosphatase MutT (NUDIX family)